jgi:neutral ceramidase
MFRCGMAQSECTPRPGLPLAGNFRDDYAARGVHDPLYGKALVVEDEGGNKVALLAVDVCMLGRKHVDFIRRHVSQHAAIPPERLLVAAIHNHAGPGLGGTLESPSAAEADIEMLLIRAADAVVLAAQRIGPAALRFGSIREDRVSFNRRLKCTDGRTRMNWEHVDPSLVERPWGVTDPELQALVVRSGEKLSGALVNFALHPAVLAGDNWRYSADFPGILAECLGRLETASGADPLFVSAYFNGCCGNVNHIDYSDPTQGRGFKMVQGIGSLLAVAAHEAIATAEEVSGAGVAVAAERVALDRIRITPQQVAWAEGVIRQSGDGPVRGQVDGLPDIFYARTILAMNAEQDTPAAAEVMCIRVGDLAIVGLPGEFFAEHGIRIKLQSAARRTMVIELANDALGYFPTRDAFTQGGYEPSTGSTLFVPGSGEKIVDCALRLVRRLVARD